MDDYRERIAAVQHEIWSHWMRYMFSVCTLDDSGNVTIPVDKVRRWQRQMNTDYADLTDKERESDRDQADKVLAERDAEIAALRRQVAELQAWKVYHDRRMSIAVGALAEIENTGAELAPYNEHEAQLQMFDTAQDALKRISKLDDEQT